VAIQLCYDKSSTERAVSWSPQRGHEHVLVDDGEASPLRNQTPLFVADGPFRKDRIVEAFLRAAEALDPAIRSFVVARLLELPAATGAAPGERNSA